MVNEIAQSNVKGALNSPLPAQIAQTDTEHSILTQGITAFEQIFEYINPFAEDSADTHDELLTQEQAPLTATNVLIDNEQVANTQAEQAISNELFGDILAQSESLANLPPEEVTFLQQTLVDALKRSLLNTESSSTDQQSVDGKTTANQDLLSNGEPTGFWQSVSNIAFGDDGFDVKDAFDSINILNHIPIVADFYKETTHSSVNAFSSITGSLLLGGPGAAAFAAADVVTEEFTGESIFGNLMNWGADTIGNLWNTPGTVSTNATTANTEAKL